MILSFTDQQKKKQRGMRNWTIANREVHNIMGHMTPTEKDDIPQIRSAIDNYLPYFRTHVPDKMIPKLYILEDHAIPLIERMGMHGGEAVHISTKYRNMFYVPNPTTQRHCYLQCRNIKRSSHQTSRHWDGGCETKV